MEQKCSASGSGENHCEDDGSGQSPGIIEVGPRGGGGDMCKTGGKQSLRAIGYEALHNAGACVK